MHGLFQKSSSHISALGTWQRGETGRSKDENAIRPYTPPEGMKEAADESEKVAGFSLSDPKFKALKQSFNMIDKDMNGSIDASELCEVLNFRGLEMDLDEAQAIITSYSTDDDDDALNFEDFCNVMRDFEDASVIDIARHFVKNVHEDHRKSISARTLDRECTESLSVQFYQDMQGPRNARLAFGKVVDGPWVHTVVFILIVVDVVCVIMELLLLATWCTDPASSHRRLSRIRFEDTSNLSSTRLLAAVETAPWCSSCANKQHTYEVVLHNLSISILMIFAVQILLVMCSIGFKFFRNAFFVLDMVVVGGALILELALHVKQGALLVVLLMWRLGRIVHGLVTSIEIGHKKMHHKINAVLLVQMKKKSDDMKLLKHRFYELRDCERDLDRVELLLKPTAVTMDNIDSVPFEELQRYAKLQLMNNHDVVDALQVLRNDLKEIEEHIEGHLEDAEQETLRLAGTPTLDRQLSPPLPGKLDKSSDEPLPWDLRAEKDQRRGSCSHTTSKSAEAIQAQKEAFHEASKRAGTTVM